jgi:hypothetical protein
MNEQIEKAVKIIEEAGLSYEIKQSFFRKSGETSGVGSGVNLFINIKGKRPVSVWPVQGSVFAPKHKNFGKSIKRKGLSFDASVYMAVQISLAE